MKEQKIPNHLAIIMDGNGRWATEQDKKRSYGHKVGAEILKKIGLYAFKKGVKVLSVYAFSIDNWKRSVEEVKFLMDLFIKRLNKEMSVFIENDIKVIVSGSKERLSNGVKEAIVNLENTTKNNKSGILNICLNYGSQDEIVNAVKEIVDEKIKTTDITKELFNKYLYNELPPIDLLIRTSGEQRLSNFMLWQVSYAELYFPKVHWPAFTKKDFDKAIEAYNKRDRRIGGVK